MPAIRAARADELPQVGRVLAAAFDGDPIWSYLAHPRANWSRAASRWFAAEARSQQRNHGEVLVDEQVRGAAVWVPPGRWKGTTRETLALAGPSLGLFRTRLARGLGLTNHLQRIHPTEEHWYLAFLGTDPAHQGGGVGSALIAEVTNRCDDQGLGAYLESSKEANVAFYGRHGFSVTQVLDRPGCPPMWLMWRNPR